MNIPDPSTLRKAIAITTEIERLEQTLHELLKNALSKSEASLSSDTQKSSVKISKEIQARPKVKASKGSSMNVAKTPAMKPVPVAEASEIAPHDPLLLVDDSGEEQLAVVPNKESCTLPQDSHAEKSCSEGCSLSHDSGHHQAGEETVSFIGSPQ